ncbi:MAG: hypothetical protein J5554_05765, partial [Paludibacteraceae bacterium]|nr:hypothetical protein [Paludibacteraceae bacterium]
DFIWDEEIDPDNFPSRAVISDPIVSYEYDPKTKGLTIVSHDQKKHCCATIGSVVSISMDTITITTTEGGNFCRCWCFYDVTTKIFVGDLENAHFIVDGVEFDLGFDDEGGYKGAMLRELRGEFLESSDCKKQKDADVPTEPAVVDKNVEDTYTFIPSRTAGTDTLVSYHYDPSTGECLIISHNVELNCCGVISSNTTFEQEERTTSIYIVSAQSGELCKCMCSYDVTTRLTNVLAQRYRFFVDGTKFFVDFSEQTDGYVTR